MSKELKKAIREVLDEALDIKVMFTTDFTKLKPRWDVHLSGDDDQPGCAG